ncbi:hypothetical protein Barb4_00910 [Bacteroidales bacterium Barb4]|nr:hypothetical protein Barb4_00910 [Bacteroidales bacterium Barb4]
MNVFHRTSDSTHPVPPVVRIPVTKSPKNSVIDSFLSFLKINLLPFEVSFKGRSTSCGTTLPLYVERGFRLMRNGASASCGTGLPPHAERGFHLMRNEASTSYGTTVPCYPACFLPHNTFFFDFPFDRVLRELRYF